MGYLGQKIYRISFGRTISTITFVAAQLNVASTKDHVYFNIFLRLTISQNSSPFRIKAPPVLKTLLCPTDLSLKQTFPKTSEKKKAQGDLLLLVHSNMEVGQGSTDKVGLLPWWSSSLSLALNEFKAKVVGLAKKVKKIGEDDPRRVVHSFKVGLALSLVSLYYYITPLFNNSFGTSAIWAVLTVVVVMEYTVGIFECVEEELSLPNL